MRGDPSSKKSSRSADDVVDAVYEGAFEPSEYLQLFEAWDRFFLDPAMEGDIEVKQRIGGARELEPHFRRAARIFELTQQSQEDDLEATLKELNYAAFVLNSSGEIVLFNDAANSLLLDFGYNSIFDCVFNADTELRIEQFLKMQRTGSRPDASEQVCATGVHPETDQNLVFVIEPTSSADPAHAALVKTTSIAWNASNDKVLMSAFGLTPAETGVIQSMMSGYSLDEIARKRGRSLSTIRTQIKMILQKTGLGSQKELLRLVTSICFILDEQSDAAERQTSLEERAKPDLQSVTLQSGRTLNYTISGDLNGRPILFLQPTTRPDFTPRLRKAFLERGLCVYSLVRPGSWGVPPSQRSRGNKQIIEDYLEFVHTLDLKFHSIVGYCSGGIYAAELARKLNMPDQNIFLIDTGAPLDKLSKIRAMPRTERRTFLTARLFPSVLLVPHKLIAADFHRSEQGERKTVEYFYADSPHDKALIGRDEYYQITRDNIAYCFENVAQLVSDVVMWTQDWSELLKDLSRTHNVHFVHGDHNLLFAAADVSALEALHPKITATIVPNAGQTLLYEHSERIADLIAE